MSVQAGEQYRFEQEVWFDGHRYAFPRGGEILITRGSDGFTWNGTDFASGETWQATTVDGSNVFHYYDWTVPVSAANGDVFTTRIRIEDDSDTESVGNMIVRPASGGGSGTRVFDGTDFVTGFPSTVG